MRAPETLAVPAGSVELPTIRPGVDRVPTRCPRPACGSSFLGYEEPLGPHQRGMLWCQQCSGSIAWIAAPARPVRARALAAAAARGAPIRADDFARTAGCGPTCGPEYGHDAGVHERYGADAVHAEITARVTGDIATGPLLVQLGPGRVFVASAEIVMAPVEYRLLTYLAGRLGELCAQPSIVVAVWGSAWILTAERGAPTLRTHMGRLRERLGMAGPLLETEPGRGYRLVDAPLC